MFTKEEKNAAATGGYSTKSEGLRQVCHAVHFPEQAVKIYKTRRCQGRCRFRPAYFHTTPFFVLIMATTGLAQYQTCIRTRKMPIQIATHTLWRKKPVVSDSLHSVVFGLTLRQTDQLRKVIVHDRLSSSSAQEMKENEGYQSVHVYEALPCNATTANPPYGHASLTHSNMLPSPDDLNISLRLKTITRSISSKENISYAQMPRSRTEISYA